MPDTWPTYVIQNRRFGYDWEDDRAFQDLAGAEWWLHYRRNVKHLNRDWRLVERLETEIRI